MGYEVFIINFIMKSIFADFIVGIIYFMPAEHRNGRVWQDIYVRRDFMAEREEREIILTKEGLEKLETELETLKSSRREEVAERIKQAIAFGDISENSEYEDAKNEQAFIEGRIFTLEQTLKKSRLMEDAEIRTDVVSLGSRVKLKAMKSGREVNATLVSSVESKLKDGKISDESPVGKAIMGKTVKTVVSVETPAGIIKYKIIKVEK
jgi:transcription elongation factor GreA